MWISCCFTVLPGFVGAQPNVIAQPDFDLTLADETAPWDVHGNSVRAVSTNFDILASALDAREVAQLCERRRTDLAGQLAEGTVLLAWNPRCEVVVHATCESYRAAVGCGGESSKGSSWIGVQKSQITRRRIDLLAECKALPALGHELTHVVLADLFDGQRPSPWADEGLAVFFDRPEKQRRHQQDLQRALNHRTIWPLATLMSHESYPPTSSFPAFYAQSASLTAFLVRQGSPSRFIHFVKSAKAKGIDQALLDEYAINGVRELERLWSFEIRQRINFVAERACQEK